MKQKSFLFGSLLLCAMAFSTTGCSIGGDDKTNEIVDDPLKDKTEYYIVGQVSDSKGVVANAKVETGNVSATTDSKGVYKLTVNDATAYKVKFTASGLQTFEAETSIASSAKNRSQVTLNVRMAKEIVYDENHTETATPTADAVVTAPNIVDTNADPATITIPAGTVTQDTKVAAVVYEEAKIATGNETQVPVSNVAVKTEPADIVAEQDVTIAVNNLADDATDGYFDTDYMSAVKKDEVATRADKSLGKPEFNAEDNRYEITIPAEIRQKQQNIGYRGIQCRERKKRSVETGKQRIQCHDRCETECNGEKRLDIHHFSGHGIGCQRSFSETGRRNRAIHRIAGR